MSQKIEELPIIFETPEIDQEDVKSYETWDEMGIKESLLKGMYLLGFNQPSPIQKKAIVPIIKRKDIRAQAHSGTGKTGAFSIGLLQRIDEEANETQVLVIASTREVAIQNCKVMMKLGSEMNIKICCLVGGESIKEDFVELDNIPHVIVGTPGRIIHMLNDGKIRAGKIKLFVIDEADEMLKEGFVNQVKEIFLSLDRKILQTAMFSATWSTEELNMSMNLLKDPVIIDLRREEQTLKGIEQYYIALGDRPENRDQEDEYKVQFLSEIFSKNNVGQCIIFVNSKFKAVKLHQKLNNVGINCSFTHSSLPHEERKEVLNRFRNGECRTLIGTSLIGRGVDIRQLSLVFNYELPKRSEKCMYIHRIGRAGRYGRKGKAINLIFNDEMDDIRSLEEYYSTHIESLPEDLDYR